MFGGIVTSPRNTLLPQQALELARIYLENARIAPDIKIALVLCHDTEVSLAQAKKSAKHAKDTSVQDGVAAVYNDLGLLLRGSGYHSEAQASFEKAQKLGAPKCDPGQLQQHQHSRPSSAMGSIKSALIATAGVPVTFALSSHLSLPAALNMSSNSPHGGEAATATLIENTADPQTDTAAAPLKDIVMVPNTNAATLLPHDSVSKEHRSDMTTPPNDPAVTGPSTVVTVLLNDNTTILRGNHATIPPTDNPTSDSTVAASVTNTTTPEGDIATIPMNIFIGNVRPPTISFKPPEADERLHDTLQLACCLGLLQISTSLDDDIADPVMLKWVQATKSNPDEKERLETMAKNVIRAFKRDELKDSKAVTEVVYLAPVLEKDDFQYLLREFYSGIEHSGLLDVQQLEGLAQLIQGADTGFIEADDFVKILKLLSTRLQDTHHQSPNQLYKLTLTVSHVLDAMADAGVKDLDRVALHEPLSSFLDKLKGSKDSYLVYQAAYASQALLYVPNNESLGKAADRRTGKVIQGVSGLVSAVKGLDLNGFIGGLKEIQRRLAGVSQMVQVGKAMYDGVKSLKEGGQGLVESLKEGLSFSHKSAWYPALRGVDALIRDGQFTKFRKLVCEAPCRRDVAFQWGVCQRLRDVAFNPAWDIETRLGAIAFLGEMYTNDDIWGQHATVKQWILNIMMQLSTVLLDDMQSHHMLTVIAVTLQELGKNGDHKKQALYRVCREGGPGSHPLKVSLPEIGSPSLLDRVQERLDVEGTLRKLGKQRLKERGSAVYIPPQAKDSLNSLEGERFPLMETVEKSLKDDLKVFLILGDSGSGKSTFNRELECELWRKYEKNGPIPLHINLPAIVKPEHDMIAKQLRRAEFTEPQIRELKQYRKFILICDGYDESQQTRNLYTSNRLNEPGEWNAKMVISCRSEYLGDDYRDRFQPGDRNHRSDPSSFREAVITPFSMDQVQEYITQYVSIHRPLWDIAAYKNALNLIPSLQDLVKNPFLMSLSLEVLPRMVDPGQDLTATHITRVALYDQFIEHWLERGKRRLGEKELSPQARSAYESLIDEGFTRNGIDYLKKLSAAIYKEQGGQPIVAYSRYKDENTWKSEFFSRDDEKQLLREACPLIRNGNQYRFIHRSLLEYGLTLAIFDPQDWKERASQEFSSDGRMSISSIMSSDEQDNCDEDPPATKQKLDVESPLTQRSFIKEPSLQQFLEERVSQEPIFKQQLLDYIEQSKSDKKWRVAAANAITILVRAGVQFNGADFRGIQIPKADLSYGMFDSTQFQGADLRQVDFRGAWLRQADLTNSQMADVSFGELPLLEQDAEAMMSVYSPDGESLAVGLSDGKINLYSTSTWERLHTFDEHTESIKCLVYSPGGHQIASGSEDTTVRLWDMTTRTCHGTLRGHKSGVLSVAYSPRGDIIVSSSWDCSVRLWDLDTGECRHILRGHTDYVLGVIYSPNGNQIASCSSDSTVRLWNTDSKVYSHTLRGHRDRVRMISYSPRGHQIASASDDRTVRLWDVATGDCRHILKGHNDCVVAVAYSPKGDQVASASRDHTARLWDIETGVCLHILRGHGDSVVGIAYSPQGDMTTSSSWDKTVRLWDVGTGVCHQTLTGHSGWVNNAVFSPKGDQVASSCSDKTVRLWDTGSGTSRNISSSQRGSVRGVKCSPRGDQIACRGYGGSGHIAMIWDIATGSHHTLRGHTGDVLTVVYSPSGHQIATGSRDSTVRLWNTETGTCTHTLEDHIDGVDDIVYSPLGGLLASLCGDYMVRIWDTATGECRYTMEGHTGYIEDVAYSPAGHQIASCSGDKTVRLWSMVDGVCVHVLSGHKRRVGKVMYSPQGNQIISASDDCTLRLWDVVTGECRFILIGHDTAITSITYSPRGNQVVSSSEDRAALLWDIETWDTTQALVGHSDAVIGVGYSPQGDLIVSAIKDKSVRLWDASSGQSRAELGDFQGTVNGVDWIVINDILHLATCCEAGSVRLWKILNDGNRFQVSLVWSATMSNELIMSDTIIQDVRGLSEINKRLLEQRGAVGDPAPRLREMSKKSVDMETVVSKFKSLPKRIQKDTAASTGGLSGEFDHRFEKLEHNLEQLEHTLEHKFEHNLEQLEHKLEHTLDHKLEHNLEQLEHKLEQAKDAMLQDVMAVLSKNAQESK